MCQNQTHLTLQLLNASFIKGLNLLKMHIGRMYSVLLEKIFDNPIFFGEGDRFIQKCFCLVTKPKSTMYAYQ